MTTNRGEGKTKPIEWGQLIGVAKILDSLWEDSYDSLGKDTSKRLEQEMIYYFGENWCSDMYEVIRKDGKSGHSQHPEPVKTLKELGGL